MDAFKLDDHGAVPSSTEESAKLSELGFGAAEFGFLELKKEGYEEKQACYFEPGDFKEYTPLPPYPGQPSPGSPLARPASPKLLYDHPESSSGPIKQGKHRSDSRGRLVRPVVGLRLSAVRTGVRALPCERKVVLLGSQDGYPKTPTS